MTRAKNQQFQQAEVDHRPEATVGSSFNHSSSVLKQAKQALEGGNCRWTEFPRSYERYQIKPTGITMHPPRSGEQPEWAPPKRL